MEPQTNESVISEDELKMPEDASAHVMPDKPSYLGIILGALIIILILLLGGLYLWSTTLEPLPTADTTTRPTAEENNEPESTNAEANVETAGALSTSNELDAIEADLSSTNVNTVDADILTIDEAIDMETMQ